MKRPAMPPDHRVGMPGRDRDVALLSTAGHLDAPPVLLLCLRVPLGLKVAQGPVSHDGTGWVWGSTRADPVAGRRWYFWMAALRSP